MDEERVLSIRSAARRLDLSSDTIRRKIKTGELSAFKIGRQVRVSADDVERLLRPVAPRGPAAA